MKMIRFFKRNVFTKNIYNRCCFIFLWCWQTFVPLCFQKRLQPIVVRSLAWWRNAGNAEDDNSDNSEPVQSLHQDVEGYSSETLVDPESVIEDEEEEEEEDEFYCCYDSTWEDEPSQNRTKGISPSSSYRSYKFSRFQNAAKDMQTYRHDYPNRYRNQHFSQPEARSNLKFYLGKAPCLPDGLFISEIHKNWYGDYNKLEYVHTYIQWLFPLQEPGMNSQASVLTKQEIAGFLYSDLAKQNLLRSYTLMLDFYGIKLVDETTGKVRRADNWMERFENLNSHTHNSLRITRILKCLGTLGYPGYQAPLAKFFLKETLVNGQLPNIKESVLNYFVFAVLDKMERRKLLKFAYKKFDPTDEFVWCPKKIQMSLLQQMNEQDAFGGEASRCSAFHEDADRNTHSKLTDVSYV